MAYLGRTPTPSPVTVDDIPANSIDASKIIDGSIELAEISDGAITATKLASAVTDAIDANSAKVTNSDQSKADIEALGIAASSITGALPAISGAALTNLPGGGLYSAVAVICDQKASGTNGGTFTAGAWRTRDLNTEITDADGIVSISSNQFTLQAGTYTISATAVSYKSAEVRLKLQNITDATAASTGTSHFFSDAHALVGFSDLPPFVVTIGSAKAFELQHWCNSSTSTNGFGWGLGAPGGSVVEKLATVVIHKHA